MGITFSSAAELLAAGLPPRRFELDTYKILQRWLDGR